MPIYPLGLDKTNFPRISENIFILSSARNYVCVARCALFFNKSYMRTIGRPGKNICTPSSHRATRELYAKVPSHRAPVGDLCEGSMRIELRPELYAKGALCGFSMQT